MNISGEHPAGQTLLSEEALEQVANTLSDRYHSLYGELTAKPGASLTGNLIAFVFRDGLSVSDERMLGRGHAKRVREFRENFFEVVSDKMAEVVSDLTGVPVTYSFYGFDPNTRTSHAIFVLDLGSPSGVDGGQGRPSWSDQVLRNARRLRGEMGR